MNTGTSANSQPAAFKMIFFLEFWERFGFYGLQVVLTYFFVRELGMSDEESFSLFGIFSAMLFGYIAIGGWLGDKIIGTQKAILLGLVTLTLGYFLMGFSGSHHAFVYLALSCIVVGNGLFKANPSSLLAKLYERDDPRLDSAFTLYYMAINVGSLFSMTLIPIIGGKWGLTAGFYVCVIGMFCAIGNFLVFRRLVGGIDSAPGLRPLSPAKGAAVLGGVVGLIAVSYWFYNHAFIAKIVMGVIISFVFLSFIYYIVRERGAVRAKMIAALVLIVYAVFFFTLYQQMPTSLNFFAIKNVEHVFLGLEIKNATIFQSLNPFWIVVASPVLAYLYTKYGRQGRDLSMPAKFALGMLLCSAAFLVVYASSFFANEKGLVSPWWIVACYFFQSVGELLISGLGLSMVAKLVPERMTGYIMGAWFLSSAISGFTGAWVAKMTAVPKNVVDPLITLDVYSGVFMRIGLVTLAVSAVMFLTVPLLNKLINKKDN